MKHNTSTRNHLVLSMIRQVPGVTWQDLSTHLTLCEEELLRALSMLKRRRWIKGQGRGNRRNYVITLQGDAGWHEYLSDVASPPEQLIACERHRQRALALESRQLWYRAAHQWLLVLDLCPDDASRLETLIHRARCMQKATLKTSVRVRQFSP